MVKQWAHRVAPLLSTKTKIDIVIALIIGARFTHFTHFLGAFGRIFEQSTQKISRQERGDSKIGPLFLGYQPW